MNDGQQRRGLGRGLGSLIPHRSPRSARSGARGSAGGVRPRLPTRARRRPRAPDGASRTDGRPPRPAAAPAHGRGRLLRRAARSTRSRPNARPAPPGLRRGGDGRAGALDPRGRACSSRSSCGAPATDAYELVMGERRWRAAQEAGLETIPAIVRETDDNDMLRDALLENLHRSQLNPLEEAAAYAPAARGLRLHPRGAGPADRPLPAPDQQHPAAAQALARRPAPGGRRRALGRPRPRRCSPSRTPTLQDRLAAAGRGRGHQRARARGDRRRRRPRTRRLRARPRSKPDRPRARRPGRAALRPVRDPGQGRPRPGQGQDHRRVRLASTTCGGSSTSWTRATATTGRSEPISASTRQTRSSRSAVGMSPSTHGVRSQRRVGAVRSRRLVDESDTSQRHRAIRRVDALRLLRALRGPLAGALALLLGVEARGLLEGGRGAAAARRAATRSRAAARRRGSPRSASSSIADIRACSCGGLARPGRRRWGAAARRP